MSLRGFFELPPPRTAAVAADRRTRARVRKLANEGRGAEIVVAALVIAVLAIAIARGAKPSVVIGVTVVSAMVAGPFLFFFEVARRRNRLLIYDGTLVRGQVTSVEPCSLPAVHGRGERGQEVIIEFTISEQATSCHAIIPDGYAGGEIAEVGRHIDLVAHANGEDVLVLGDGWQLIAPRG